jgi:hypothetical protein
MSSVAVGTGKVLDMAKFLDGNELSFYQEHHAY